MKLSYFYLMCFFMFIDVCLLIGTLVYKNKKGSKSLAAVIVLNLISQLFYAASLLITNEEIKFAVHELKFIGVAFYSMAFAVMYMDFFDKKATSRVKGLLSFVPAITVILAITNNYHHLFRTSLYVIDNEYGSFVGVQSGTLFMLYIVYSYAVYIVGIAIVIKFFFKTPKIYRMQIGIMIFAAVSTLCVNFISIFGIFFEDFGDLTLISFTLAVSIQFYGLILYKPTRLIELARSMAVNDIKNPMLIFDYNNVFMDANTAAQKLFELEENEMLQDFLNNKLGEIGELDYSVPESYTTLNNSYYTVNRSIIKDENGVASGTVVLLTDMTELKNREKELNDLANHDYFTGIPNRHSFLQEINKIRDDDLPTAIIHFNISGMRNINNTYGSDRGDEIIKQVAVTLAGAAKRSGFCAILGGDEFALMLKNTSEAAAGTVIKEIYAELIGITLVHGLAVKRSSMDNIQLIMKNSLDNLHMNKVLNHLTRSWSSESEQQGSDYPLMQPE